MLQDVSFVLTPGVTGLLGPNGAGKTTLLTLLTGQRRVRDGRLTVLGVDMARRGAARQVSGGTGYLPQEFGYLPGYTVTEFVAYAAWLKGVARSDVDSSVAEAVRAVGLGERASSKMRTLSGGMRRRAGIAASIVHRPALLLLDEPTAGLDPAQRHELREILLALRERTAVLLSTHLTDDVASTCDKVFVLDQTRMRFEGSPAELAARDPAAGSRAGSALEGGYLATITTTPTPR